MKPQIVGQAMPATRYPQNVLILARADAPIAVASPYAVHPPCGIDLAATTSPVLAAWLAETINRVLAGAVQPPPRPPGTLVECGHFYQSGTRVLARSWLGSEEDMELARCADAEGARQLADRLNGLLRTP